MLINLEKLSRLALRNFEEPIREKLEAVAENLRAHGIENPVLRSVVLKIDVEPITDGIGPPEVVVVGWSVGAFVGGVAGLIGTSNLAEVKNGRDC